jgi:chorismate mutase / prephenate dehydratase
MSVENTLNALRQEIDQIDDTIHDLLIRRTEVVKKVRIVKHGYPVKIRPAREAEIIYRLLTRHKGPFPKQELFRIWREMIVATLSMEGPFSVAVYVSDDNDGYWDMARDQYGSFAPMTPYKSAHKIVEAVQNQTAVVGILAVPKGDDKDPWWPALVSADAEAPKVIAKLPFAGPGNGRTQNLEALAICPVPQEPTGRDRSFVGFKTEQEIPANLIEQNFLENGFSALFNASSKDKSPSEKWCYLVEVDGFVDKGDARLPALSDALGGRVIHLGGYATPLGADELVNNDEAEEEGTSP